MMKSLFTVAALVATTGTAFATPGHDHNSWTAPLLHAIWAAPVVVSAAAAFFYFRKKSTK